MWIQIVLIKLIGIRHFGNVEHYWKKFCQLWWYWLQSLYLLWLFRCTFWICTVNVSWICSIYFFKKHPFLLKKGFFIGNYEVLTKAEALRNTRSDDHPVQFIYPAHAYEKAPRAELLNDESSLCQTPGCIKAAVKVMDSLDESVDPCDNFYEFACI